MCSDSGDSAGHGRDIYRAAATPVAQIRVLSETESRASWAFEVELAPGRPPLRVTLGFADYDYWSRGMIGPARVVEALVRVLAEQRSPLLERESFDAARARRVHRDLDALLPQML